MPRYIGKEMSRVDGVAKVTGRAKYAAEFAVPNLAYGFIVLGSVAKGSIKTIDTQEAERAAGVVRVFTHLNTPKLGQRDRIVRCAPVRQNLLQRAAGGSRRRRDLRAGALRGAPGQSLLQPGART